MNATVVDFQRAAANVARCENTGSDLEARIGRAEASIKELEAAMSAPGFYENHEAAKPILDRHQALMWEVGDLMGQWEALQEE